MREAKKNREGERERQIWRAKGSLEGCDERPHRSGVVVGRSTERKTWETCTYERTMERYFNEKESSKDAQCRGATEDCSLNPVSASTFGLS